MEHTSIELIGPYEIMRHVINYVKYDDLELNENEKSELNKYAENYGLPINVSQKHRINVLTSCRLIKGF